jgi:hypothetical protein
MNAAPLTKRGLYVDSGTCSHILGQLSTDSFCLLLRILSHHVRRTCEENRFYETRVDVRKTIKRFLQWSMEEKRIFWTEVVERNNPDFIYLFFGTGV